MNEVASDLVGAIVEVTVNKNNGSVTLLRRGVVRAVTVFAKTIKGSEYSSVASTTKPYLRLWIEELDAAESACWFGEKPSGYTAAPGSIAAFTIETSQGVRLRAVRRPFEVASGE